MTTTTSSSPVITSSVGVKNLRALFEKKVTIVQTPQQFLESQRIQVEREAQAILLAKQKAAAFNMAVRQIELESAMGTEALSASQATKRENLRVQARRVSAVLRNLDETESRPAKEIQDRRATNLLLASMAEELEAEMKREEELALKEEEAARQRAEEMRNMEERSRAESKAAEAAEQAARAKQEAEFANLTAMLAVKEAMEVSEASPPPSAAAENDKDRAVLTAYLRENYPEKIGEVDTLLRDFAGNLDVLFAELAKDQKFEETPERPVTAEGAGTVARKQSTIGTQAATTTTTTTTMTGEEESLDALSARRGEKSFLAPGVNLRDVVIRFYGIFAPSKLRDIDDILKHFDNREADLFRTLEVKYDVTFTADGTCTPNDAALVELDASRSSSGGGSKFAVSPADIALKERLKQQGVDKAGIDSALSGGSGMM